MGSGDLWDSLYKDSSPQTFNHVDENCQCEGRRCNGCEKVKCLGNFYQDRRWKGTFTWLCKLCYGKKVKQYKQTHPDMVDAGAARYHRKSKERRRQYWLHQLYGLTEFQFQEMFARQQGRCLMCGEKSDKVLQVDHDHKTGDVRALLCSRCNSLLGYADDSIELLKRAIAYLESFKEEDI